MEEISNETEIESYDQEKGIVDVEMVINSIELTEDLKTQFLNNHYFFEYNGQAYFKEASSMIYHHVSKKNKITFKQFPVTIQNNINSWICDKITDYQSIPKLYSSMMKACLICL